MANREKREPEFDADVVHNLSIDIYKMRLVAGSGEGAVERMIAQDKDNGEKLSNRATAYDALSRCYLRALKRPDMRILDWAGEHPVSALVVLTVVMYGSSCMLHWVMR